MPVPTKPSLYISWVPSGAPPYVTQPPSSLQTTGWVPGEVPPPDFMNWLFYILDQWVQWLDYEVENVITVASGISANSTVLSTTGNISISANTITSLASTTGILVGQLIVGSGIPTNTYVLSISGSTVTMSQNATATLAANPTSFEHFFATGANVQLQLDELDAALTLQVSNIQRTFTASTSLSVNDGFVRSDSTSGNLIQTLPPIASVPLGKKVIVKDVGTGGNYTSVKGNASETIDGNNTYATTLAEYDSITVRSNGTTWDVI